MFEPLSSHRFASRAAIALLVVIGTASSPATAQVAAPFVGAWRVSWQTDKKSYEATMKITDSGGTWQTHTQERNNPCFGREVPMKIEKTEPTEITLTLQFSEVIHGCPNTNVTLKAAADGTVTGVRSKFELALTRQ